MRITGGKYVRHPIVCPKGEIRPAMDKMRESLFHILGDVSGLSFLDLFSGSGVVGIEAASRGCEPVVIVERDKRKRTTLLENTSIVETEIRVLFMPAERFVQQCSDQFFLIFLDPPFSYAYKLELIREIAEAGILTSGGILMIHYPKEEDLPQEIEGLTCYDLRRFGRSKLAFFTLSCPGE